MDEDGFPRNPIAKHGFNRSTGNPFDNAVVTVDEVRRRGSFQSPTYTLFLL